MLVNLRKLIYSEQLTKQCQCERISINYHLFGTTALKSWNKYMSEVLKAQNKIE